MVGGAQGVSTDHDVTFLGRGGSDTTAVALCHALGGDACELYTDVPGVFTADPRIVPQRPAHGPGVVRRAARDDRHRLPQAGDAVGRVRPPLERQAARPLGLHLGAGHLGHRGGPVHGAGRSSPPSRTTRARPRSRSTGVPDQPGIAARLFRELADVDVNVDMIVQNVSDHGVTDISFTVPKDDLAARHRGLPAAWPTRSAPPACPPTATSPG